MAKTPKRPPRKTRGTRRAFDPDLSLAPAKRTPATQVVRGVRLLQELYDAETGRGQYADPQVTASAPLLTPHPTARLQHQLTVWMARHSRKAEALVERAWPLASWDGACSAFFWDALLHYRPDLIERALVLAATDPQGGCEEQEKSVSFGRAGVLRALMANAQLKQRPHLGPIFHAHVHQTLSSDEGQAFDYHLAWWCFTAALGFHEKKQGREIDEDMAALNAILAHGAAHWTIRRAPGQPAISLAHVLCATMMGGMMQHWTQIEQHWATVIDRLIEAGCSLDGQIDPHTSEWSDGPVEAVRHCLDATNQYDPPQTQAACEAIMGLFLSRGANWRKALAALEPDKPRTRAALLQHPVVRREQLMGQVAQTQIQQLPHGVNTPGVARTL